MDADWMRLGNCRDKDPAMFFPSDGVGVQVAQRICAECAVKTPCLEYALVNKIYEGVWGGAVGASAQTPCGAVSATVSGVGCEVSAPDRVIPYVLRQAPSRVAA
jgi:WhiB family redox-sensing transcriptional regulator